MIFHANFLFSFVPGPTADPGLTSGSSTLWCSPTAPADPVGSIAVLAESGRKIVTHAKVAARQPEEALGGD